LLFVKVAVRDSSEFAKFVSGILISGFVTLKGRDDGLSSLVGAEELLATEGFDIRIEFDHHAQVLERILLSGSSQSGLFGRVDLALDLAGSDQAVEIRVGNQRSGQSVVELQLGLGLVGSIESIKFFISVLGPDNESSKMATGGKEKNVQAVNGKDVNTRKVAEGSEESAFLFVDDQRSLSLNVSPVSGLAFSGSDLLSVLDLLNIGISFKGFEEFDGLGGFIKGSDGVGAHDEGDFRDFLDSVTSGEDERCRRRSSEGRDEGIASLVEVNLSVPSSVDFGRGEHSTASAHVTESSLSGSVGTSSSDSRNTGNSTTCTPRFS